MSENKGNFNQTVESLFKGLDGFLSTKTVVGEAIHVGEDILIPLADVSFGIGASAFSGEKKDGAGAGGLGAKMTPAAVLRISKDGSAELINLKNQDAVSKIIDMTPGLVSRFMKKSGKGSGLTPEEETVIFEKEEESV